MLMTPQAARRSARTLLPSRRAKPLRVIWALAAGLSLPLASLASALPFVALPFVALPFVALPVAAAQDPPVSAEGRAPRPPDLKILWRSESVLGSKQIGIFGARTDARQPGLWSVQVWEETRDRVTIATDRIGCTLQMPVRITGTGSQTYVRQLNPGGAIHDANRLDHLIWWAVCQPELAGRDPAGLTKEARRLGFSGNLREQQEVVLSSP